jgi:mono/diheme cytochrome c family protein
VLAALNGWEIGLLVVAAVFCVFALTVALVVPRSRPEFPAQRLGVFLAVCIALFAAQMTAVLLLAEVGEADEPVAHEETQPTEPGGTEPAPTEPAPTEPAPTEPAPTEGETTVTTPPAEPTGDAAAGKDVFASAGCASCHTLADAGSTGTIGPELDATMPSYELAVERVTNGSGAMPPFRDMLSEQQIQDVAAYVSSVAGG